MYTKLTSNLQSSYHGLLSVWIMSLHPTHILLYHHHHHYLTSYMYITNFGYFCSFFKKKKSKSKETKMEPKNILNHKL